MLHLSCKIILANLTIWCSKTQPRSGNQRLDLLTCLTHVSHVLPQPRKIHLCRSSSNLPRPPSLLKLFQNPHVWLSFNKMQNPLRLPEKAALERPKVGRKWNAFTILTLERASCHNGVHFLISHLARCLCTRYLRSLLFDPPKRPFDLFDVLSSDSFSSLPPVSSLHIVGSLTFKLLSLIAI